jgi:rubredoxin
MDNEEPAVTGRRLVARVMMRRPIVTYPNLMTEKQDFKTWMCLICGFLYEEEKGLPEEGVPPGTRWEEVPMNWTCPECGARKEDFEMLEL